MASAASAAQRPTQRSRTLCAFVVPTPWSCVVADSHEDVSRQDDRVLSFDTKTRHVKVAAAKDTDAAAHAFCDVLPASLRERWIGEPVWGDGITTQEGAGTKRLLLRPSHIFCPVARAREGVAASVAALASSPHFLDQAALAVASGLDAVMYIEGALLSHATLLGLSDGDESKPPEYRGYKRAFTPLEQTITNQSAFSVEPVPPEAPEKRPYVGGHASVAITVGEFTVACLFAYLAEGAANVAPLNDENGVGKLAAHPTIMTHIAAAAATQGGPRLGDVASLGLLPIAIGRIMTTLTLPSISASESWSPVPGSSYSIQLAFHCIQQGEMLSLVRRESDGSAVMDGTSTAQRYEFVSDVENVKRPETPTNDPLVSSPLCVPTAQSPPAPAITPYQSTNEVVLAEPETSWISVRTVEDVATLCRIAKAARRTESKHFGKTPSNHVIVVQCRVRQFVLPADVAASATITNKVGSQALIMSSTMTFVSGAAVTSRVHLTNPASQPLRVLQNTLRARTSINMDTNFLKNITQSPLTQIMSRALTGRALLFSAVLAEATEPEMTVDNLTSSARNVSMLAHPPWKRDRAAPRVYGVCHMLERVSKAEYLARLSIVEFECRAWEMLLKDGNKTCACKAVMLL